MSFSYDAKDQKPTSGHEPIPDGEYPVRISYAADGQTKAGDNKVTCHFEVAAGLYAGRRVQYHTVPFLPPGSPGAGICLHFLKTIGEPYEGKLFTVSPQNWIGKFLVIRVMTDDRGYNKVVAVKPYEGQPVIPPREEGEVPF